MSATLLAGGFDNFFFMVFTPGGGQYSIYGGGAEAFTFDNSGNPSLATFTCSVPFGGSGPASGTTTGTGKIYGCNGSSAIDGPVTSGGGDLAAWEASCPNAPTSTVLGSSGVGSTSQAGTYMVLVCLQITGGSQVQGDYGTAAFTITSPTSAPEFPLGLALLFALMVPALLVLKSRVFTATSR